MAKSKKIIKKKKAAEAKKQGFPFFGPAFGGGFSGILYLIFTALKFFGGFDKFFGFTKKQKTRKK